MTVGDGIMQFQHNISYIRKYARRSWPIFWDIINELLELNVDAITFNDLFTSQKKTEYLRWYLKDETA